MHRQLEQIVPFTPVPNRLPVESDHGILFHYSGKVSVEKTTDGYQPGSFHSV